MYILSEEIDFVISNCHIFLHSKSPSLQYYGVTRGQLPQRAGSLGLNGGGAAAAVPPMERRGDNSSCLHHVASYRLHRKVCLAVQLINCACCFIMLNDCCEQINHSHSHRHDDVNVKEEVR